MDSRLARAVPVTPLITGNFADCLTAGLSRSPKEIPCKYFYDAEGSRLFDAICALPEYYQTRTETALLRRHAGKIAALIGPGVEILEFGAGSLRKVRILLDALEAPSAYTPLDISGAYLAEVVRTLAADYPALRLRPRRIGFFPGGTIGNFTPDAARTLLRRMRGVLNGGGLLVGVDLVKDPARLHAAYNDAAGVTAAFNKNLLARANRELGADFDLDGFAHYAPYNPTQQRIEMYLVSLRRQSVTVAGRRFDFAQGEAVHTEDSHKYTLDSFRGLAAQAGFRPRAVWTDPERLFSLHWLES